MPQHPITARPPLPPAPGPPLITVPPRLPMAGYYRQVETDYGSHEFTAEALQPAGCALLMEFSRNLEEWEPLGWWAPYAEDQQVSVAVVTRHRNGYIRATPGDPSQLGTRNPEPGTPVLPGQWCLTARGDLRDGVTVTKPVTRTQLEARLVSMPVPPEPPPRPTKPSETT